MSDNKISPANVTKPIQLLAAWLVGLLSLNASFLLSAANIHHPVWASGFLVICAALNVPIFLFCLFMLQTKFRPEMQEDQFYSKYLESRYSIETGQSELISFKVKPSVEIVKSPIDIAPDPEVLPNFGVDIRINDLLPQYSDIVIDLISNNYKIAKRFGSSGKGNSPPERFLVSVTHDFDPLAFKNIMKIISNYGVDLVGPVKILIEERNAIYIGSYSYKFEKGIFMEYNAEIAKKIEDGR